MTEVRVLPSAVRDLVQIMDYLAQTDPGLGVRFHDAVRKAWDEIGQNPEMGSLKQYASPKLREIRSWRVRGFKSHLVFYRIESTCVRVLAVMHGARNIERLFNERL